MKRVLSRFVALLAAVVFAVQLSGCGATAGIKPSQMTCGQFLQKMQSHQYKAAYALLSTPCKTATTQQQLQNYWELVEKNRGKVTGWSQQGVQFYSGTGGSTVNLTYGLQCARGNSGVQLKCVPENEKWLIQAFNFSG